MKTSCPSDIHQRPVGSWHDCITKLGAMLYAVQDVILALNFCEGESYGAEIRAAVMAKSCQGLRRTYGELFPWTDPAAKSGDTSERRCATCQHWQTWGNTDGECCSDAYLKANEPVFTRPAHFCAAWKRREAA